MYLFALVLHQAKQSKSQAASRKLSAAMKAGAAGTKGCAIELSSGDDEEEEEEEVEEDSDDDDDDNSDEEIGMTR